MNHEPSNIDQLLDRMEVAARNRGQVPLGAILEEIGNRSFGALLLLAGLILIAPIVGDIPGVPTLMGLFVILITTQLLLRRRHFWLPAWLLERNMDQNKVCRGIRWMRRPARWVDRLLRPRLLIFTREPAVHAIAAVSLVIASMLPVMEVIPFSGNIAGAALLTFGLSLTARDGLLALIAFVFAAINIGAVLYAVL